MEIIYPRLSHISNDRYIQLHTQFKELIEEYLIDILDIRRYFESSYLVLFEKLRKARRRRGKSSITKLIANANLIRDEVFLGIGLIVRGYLKHWDKNISEAARKIQILLNRFDNLTKKSLDAKSACITALLDGLENNYAAEVSLLNLDEWVVKLREANDEFSALMSERFKEIAEKSEMTFREVRLKLDDVFRRLCEIIEAYEQVDEDGVCKKFIRTFNIILARYF